MQVVQIVIQKVSNPWREAIEVEGGTCNRDITTVSNPWREAIEVAILDAGLSAEDGFQSLEGGY